MGVYLRSPWVIPSLLLVTGCGRSDHPATDDRGVGLQVPMESCVKEVAATGRLVEIASIMPVEFRPVGQTQPHDSGWLPVNLADVVPFGDALAALDAGSSQVTIFSRDFQARRTFGREGGGPSEFRRPVALGADAETGRLVVVDQGNGRLVFLDSTGTSIETWPTDARGAEDVSLSAGNVLVSHFIMSQMLGGDSVLGYVLTAQRAGAPQATLLVVATPTSLDSRRFPLPGPIPFASAGAPRIGSCSRRPAGQSTCWWVPTRLAVRQSACHRPCPKRTIANGLIMRRAGGETPSSRTHS